MKRALWGLLAFLGALWSLLAWAIWEMAGAGSRVVNWFTKLFQLEPASTQWLADAVQMAGGLAQILVAIFWLMGVGVLFVIGWAAGRTASGMREISQNLERELERERMMRTPGNTVEGQIVEKTVERG